jgi:hypothetical protein
MLRCLARAVIASLVLSAGGCTLVGLAVGSGVGRYRDEPNQPTPPEDCEAERAVLKAPAGASVRERHAEIVMRTPTGLLVRSQGQARPVLWSDVEHTQCKEGTYAPIGAAAGAIADATVLVVFVAVKISQQPSIGSTKF